MAGGTAVVAALALQSTALSASADPTPSPTAPSSSDSPSSSATPSATLPSTFTYKPTKADATMAKSVTAAKAKVTALQQEASAIGEQANAFAITVDKQQRKVNARAAAVAAQTRVVTAKQRAISALVVATLQQGGVGPNTSFLVSPNPAQIVQQGTTAQSVTDQQAGAMQALQNAKAGLADLQAGARSELAALKLAQRNLAAKKAQADAKVKAADAILAGLSKQQKLQIAVEARRQQMAQMRAATQAAAASARSQAKANSAAGFPNGLPAAASAGAAAAVRFALAQQGKPYVWGADGPDSYDCSGLTMMAWRAGGVSLPHQSGEQYGSSPQVSVSSIQPGDLVFYYSPISHVGIYIGNGQIVHAPHPGAPVRTTGLNSMPITGVTRP